MVKAHRNLKVYFLLVLTVHAAIEKLPLQLLVWLIAPYLISCTCILSRLRGWSETRPSY